MGWIDWSFGEDRKRYKSDLESVYKALDSNDRTFGGSKGAFIVWKMLFSGDYNFEGTAFKRQIDSESIALSEVVIALSKDGHHDLALEGIDLIQDKNIKAMTATDLDSKTLEYANNKYAKD